MHAQGTMAWRSRQPPSRIPCRMHRGCPHRHPANHPQPASRHPRRLPRGRPVARTSRSAGNSGPFCRLTCATQRGSRHWECERSVLTWRGQSAAAVPVVRGGTRTGLLHTAYYTPRRKVCLPRGRHGHHCTSAILSGGGRRYPRPRSIGSSSASSCSSGTPRHPLRRLHWCPRLRTPQRTASTHRACRRPLRRPLRSFGSGTTRAWRRHAGRPCPPLPWPFRCAPRRLI